MKILGVTIDHATRQEVNVRVDAFLAGETFHQIATVNPEFLLEAEKNPEFRHVLNGCNLRVVDGFGIVLAGWFHGVRFHRYPGSDLMLRILAKAEREHLPVFFAVKRGGLSTYDDVVHAVQKIYPKLIFSGEDIDFGNIGNWKLEIGNSAIVFCNAGSPLQELFIERLKKRGAPSRIGMGVGGSFDYLTGKRKRAPRWMRRAGLEWLWRLITLSVPCGNHGTAYPKSRRAFRIWNATVVFLWKIATEKRNDLHS